MWSWSDNVYGSLLYVLFCCRSRQRNLPQPCFKMCHFVNATWLVVLIKMVGNQGYRGYKNLIWKKTTFPKGEWKKDRKAMRLISDLDSSSVIQWNINSNCQGPIVFISYDLDALVAHWLIKLCVFTVEAVCGFSLPCYFLCKCMKVDKRHVALVF